MLYDILLALFGHSGDIVQECVEVEATYIVSNDIKLSITERDAINNILKTASLYKMVKQFCDSMEQNDYYADLAVIFDKKDDWTTFSGSDDNRTVKLGSKNLVNSSGYYLSALCNGIQYYLKGYRYVLLKMEDILTSDDPLPISTFSVLMKDQNEILTSINRIIVNYNFASIKCDEADVFSKSRELLDILSEGIDDKLFNEICRRLKSDVLNFLKFQLKSWICYGHLLDPYCEFVISYRDMNNVDPDSQMPLNTLGLEGFGSEYENYHSRLLQYEWNYKFYIKLGKRSNFGPIEYRSCKSILFIGKVIRMLSRSSTVSRQNLISLADEYIFSVWEEISMDADKFYSAIEKYRIYVSTLFWNFVSKNFNISSQIELFKNVYLMGYDYVYLDFFEEVYGLMSNKYIDKSFKIISSKLLSTISLIRNLTCNSSSENVDYDSDGLNKGNGTSGTQELSLISGNNLLNEEEMLNKENQDGQLDGTEDNMYGVDNFELIKYVNNFDINSKFIDINDVKYEYGTFHIGSDSSLWYSEPIFVIHNFNIHLIVDMNKLESFKQFSIVLSSNYFNSFDEPIELTNQIFRMDQKIDIYLDQRIQQDVSSIHEIDTEEYICVNFRFLYCEKNEELKILITVIYKNMYNNNNKTNKSIIIGRKKEVVKYNGKEELTLELDMSFNKNSLKINLKSFRNKIHEFVTNYSIESIYNSRSNSYEDDRHSRENQDVRLDDSEDDDLNSTLFYRTSSASDFSEIVDSDGNKDGNLIDVSMEITSLDIIEILKLISNSLYIGIINHRDLEEEHESYRNNRKESENLGVDDKKNEDIVDYKINGSEENLGMNYNDGSITILIWDYYNNLSKYDIVPYYKVKQFLDNDSFINVISKQNNLDVENDNVRSSFVGMNKLGSYDELNDEEKVNESIGINEWIYLLLYYRYKFINFINIKSYNNIFQIIFTIKRCLYGLENRCMIDHIARSDLTYYQMECDDGEVFTLIRKLYGIKYYFQTNLKLILYYFYNHVIEPEYLKLNEFIRTSNDFQLIKDKHDEYINNILRKCVCNQYVLYSLFQCLDISFKFTYIFETIQDIYLLNDNEVDDLIITLNQMRESYQEHFSILNKNYELCIF